MLSVRRIKCLGSAPRESVTSGGEGEVEDARAAEGGNVRSVVFRIIVAIDC